MNFWINILESFSPIALPSPPVFRKISEYKRIQGILFPCCKFPSPTALPDCLGCDLQDREPVNQARPAQTCGTGRAQETRQLLLMGNPNTAAPHTKCADSSGARHWHEGHFADKRQQGGAFPVSFIWTAAPSAAVPATGWDGRRGISGDLFLLF